MKTCEYCHKDFEYVDIINHECKMDRHDLVSDLIDFADKINRIASRKQLDSLAAEKILDNITSIWEILRKEMK